MREVESRGIFSLERMDMAIVGIGMFAAASSSFHFYKQQLYKVFISASIAEIFMERLIIITLLAECLSCSQ